MTIFTSDYFCLPELNRPFDQGESEDDHGRPMVVDRVEDGAGKRLSLNDC